MKSMMAIVVSGMFLLGSSAMADQKCDNADLKVTNSYGKKIKVTKVNYRDKEDARWRDNNLKNTEITNNSTKTIKEDLEYVGNESVPKMQVEFQYWGDDNAWSNRVWSNVTTGLGGSVCIDGKDYNITVSSIGSKQ